MKRLLFIALVCIGLSGCCSYKNAHIVWYWKNEIMESLGNLGEYSVYDFQVPFKGIMDNYEHLPAWYKILLPPRKELKKISISLTYNRCFLYSKHRGIAIVQDAPWLRKYPNGLREISADSVESELNSFENPDGTGTKLKILKNRRHFLYIDNEFRINMFNLRDEDYHTFVEFPLENFIIKRRSETRLRQKD